MPTDPDPASASEPSPDHGPATRPVAQPSPRAAAPSASHAPPRVADATTRGATANAATAATSSAPAATGSAAGVRRGPPRRDPRRQALASAIALAAAGFSVLIFLVMRPAPRPPRPATPATPATQSPTVAPADSATAARSPDAAKPIAAPATAATRSPDAFPDIEQLNSPATSIRDDLILLSNVFASWQTLFPQDGNPWGDNRDITAALSGRNPPRVALIPPGHPAISADGELLDRWGTPVQFHQLSGTAMELRSAGPDRVFYTADDTVLTP